MIRRASQWRDLSMSTCPLSTARVVRGGKAAGAPDLILVRHGADVGPEHRTGRLEFRPPEQFRWIPLRHDVGIEQQNAGERGMRQSKAL